MRFVNLFRLAPILVLGAAAPAMGARLSVVVDASKPRDKVVIQALERDFGSSNVLKIYNIESIDMANPIAKGRFLARVAAADIIIPVGAEPSELVSRELEDSSAFFIGGEILRGDYLAKRNVAGVLAFSPEDMIGTAKKLYPGLNSIAVLYTPGYEMVVDRVRAIAQSVGVAVTAQRVVTRAEIGPAARKISEDADLLWLTADPLLVHDVIFSYLLNESLKKKRPVVTPVSSYVNKGALFCAVPDPALLAEFASSRLSSWLRSDPAHADGARIVTAPPEGSVMINRPLAERWEIAIPRGLRLMGQDAR